MSRLLLAGRGALVPAIEIAGPFCSVRAWGSGLGSVMTGLSVESLLSILGLLGWRADARGSCPHALAGTGVEGTGDDVEDEHEGDQDQRRRPGLGVRLGAWRL